MVNQRVKELRKTLKMTQKQFGKLINLSQSQITAIENNVRVVTDRVISDICREYKVNPDWLINGKNEMFTDFTKNLSVEQEVKELANLYIQLEPKDKKVVKELIRSILK